jgi:enoyl-CoA hydratase
LLHEIEEYPRPVIAAIEGYCLGGGLELAMACDLRIAGDGAVFGQPEVALNALPTWGGTFRLPRLVGVGRAVEMVVFDRRIDAREALGWGLVAEVVPAGQALSRARAVAEILQASTDAETVAQAKRLMGLGYGMPPRIAQQMEYLAELAQSTSPAFEEAFGSFGREAGS